MNQSLISLITLTPNIIYEHETDDGLIGTPNYMKSLLLKNRGKGNEGTVNRLNEG